MRYSVGPLIMTRLPESSLCMKNNTECICPLARACNGKVAQSLCTCSETELERIFSRAYGGKVVAKVLKGVLKGDGCCVYQVQLLKKI